MNPEDVRHYRSINKKLAKYDWFISPYYSRMNLKRVIDFLDRQTAPQNKRDREVVGRKIADMLIRLNLEFGFRAVIVYEGYRMTPNVSKFSHLIEAGLFEMYTANHITCLSVWTPIVEGVFRSMLKMPPTKDFRIEDVMKLKAKQSEYQPFLTAILKTITRFLQRTLYSSYRNSQLCSSYNLNRHLLVHLSSNEPTYCRNNCLRLLNVLDSLLAIDFIITDEYRGIFDGNSPRVKHREQYYELLMRFAFSKVGEMRFALPEDHPNFSEEFYFGV